jgi:hypothetical protein
MRGHHTEDATLSEGRQITARKGAQPRSLDFVAALRR